MCPDLAMAVPKGGADLGRPRPVRLYRAGLRDLRTPIIGPYPTGSP